MIAIKLLMVKIINTNTNNNNNLKHEQERVFTRMRFSTISTTTYTRSQQAKPLTILHSIFHVSVQTATNCWQHYSLFFHNISYG